jgi:hypothetical protein
MLACDLFCQLKFQRSSSSSVLNQAGAVARHLMCVLTLTYISSIADGAAQNNQSETGAPRAAFHHRSTVAGSQDISHSDEELCSVRELEFAFKRASSRLVEVRCLTVDPYE